MSMKSKGKEASSEYKEFRGEGIIELGQALAKSITEEKLFVVSFIPKTCSFFFFLQTYQGTTIIKQALFCLFFLIFVLNSSCATNTKKN